METVIHPGVIFSPPRRVPALHDRWPKAGDDGVHRRSLVPAKQVVGGAYAVFTTDDRAVCTPENFLKCHKSAYVSSAIFSLSDAVRCGR